MIDDQFGSGVDQPVTQPDPTAAPPLPAPIEVASASQPAAFLQGTNAPGAAPVVSGLSPNYKDIVAGIESAGGTQVGNGGGKYQFLPSTAKQYGGNDDAAMDRLTSANVAALQQKGIPVNDTNAYVLHQQGAGAGPKLLTADPNAVAADVVGGPAAQGNKPFFYAKDGTPLTVAQSLAKFGEKVGQRPSAATASAQPAPAAQPVTTGDRMKAWLRAQSQPAAQGTAQSQPAAQGTAQPQKPSEPTEEQLAAYEAEQAAQQFQVAPQSAPVSGVVRQGGKVYFQRYGRTYDTSGNAVG